MSARRTALLVALFFASACAGRTGPMQLAPPEQSFAAHEDQALVIFMRPSNYGNAIQSSVFHLVGDENRFVGIVPARRKVAYYLEPGDHMFMVIGESADFLRADLEAGRTYYAVVKTRMGMMKARFSLVPVRAETLGTPKFASWDGATRYVVSTDAAHAWARGNANSIAAKRRKYLPAWQSKPQDSRDAATLHASDGR